MTPTDKPVLSFANLSLEPMDTEPAPSALKGPLFHAETRTKSKERRVTADRRVEIRFQDDRRSGKDRRPKKSWEPGSNL